MALGQQMEDANHEMVNMLTQQIGMVFNPLIQQIGSSYQTLNDQMGRRLPISLVHRLYKTGQCLKI